VDEPAVTPIVPGPAPAAGDPSARYGWLQLLAILLIVGGTAGLAAVAGLNSWVLDVAQPRPTGEASGLVLVAVILGALAVVLGLALHTGWSVVVREMLPPRRYRGPSLIVLLMLALIAANIAPLAVINDVLALSEGRAPSIYGSLVVLTITQASMLAVSALFVAAPRALAGLALVPSSGLARSIGLGVVLAIPAWIGAALVGVTWQRILELFGLRPEEQLVNTAINVVDPLVLVVALVVAAPLAEEIFFRGVVYNAWLREYGPWRALIGSALLFALIHGLFAFAPVFALGIALVAVYRYTGSLAGSIALHATFNGISLTLGLLQRFHVIDLGL
jgi:membrane protease YdiL (CAAX protease family)